MPLERTGTVSFDTAAAAAPNSSTGHSKMPPNPRSLQRANTTTGKTLASQARIDTQQISMRFSEFDTDGNAKLDFEEFLCMQPKRIRDTFTSEQIRSWFDAADSDGSGTLNTNEFFLWSLSNSAKQYGASAIEYAFRKYDGDGTGQLDAVEFQMAAEEMGFGDAAYAIFADLDEDGSGTVSYTELVANLTARVPASPVTKDMLNSMMWTYQRGVGEEAAHGIDTRGWTIRGKDVLSVRTELQTLLRQSTAHVSDIIRLFDIDGGEGATIDRVEFVNTMRSKLGYKGMPNVLEGVFQSIDSNGDGTVCFSELFEFVRGHRHSLDARTRKERENQMRMEEPPGLSMEMIAWDVEGFSGRELEC